MCDGCIQPLLVKSRLFVAARKTFEANFYENHVRVGRKRWKVLKKLWRKVCISRTSSCVNMTRSDRWWKELGAKRRISKSERGDYRRREERIKMSTKNGRFISKGG